MATRDPKVDENMAKSAPLEQPILRKLRDTTRAVGSELDEIVNRGAPGDEHHHQVFRAALQLPANVGFGKGALMSFPAGFFSGPAVVSTSRITKTAVRDLPSTSVFKSFGREAMGGNVDDAKRSFPWRRSKSMPVIPADLQARLRQVKKIAATYEAFSNSPGREDIKWIEVGERSITRGLRVEQTIAQGNDGKSPLGK